jgi:hypothetical protein
VKEGRERLKKIVAVRAEMDSAIEHVDYKQLVSSIAEAESFGYQTKRVDTCRSFREAVEALQLAIKEFSQPKLEASLQTAMRLHINGNAVLEEARKMLNDITNVRHRSVDAVKGVGTAFTTQGADEHHEQAVLDVVERADELGGLADIETVVKSLELLTRLREKI